MPSLADSDIESDPGTAPNSAQEGKIPISNSTMLRHRDLLPLPIPENNRIDFKGSRSVKRRLLHSSHVSGIVRDSIVALNSLCVGSDSAGPINSQPSIAAQSDVMASLNLSAQRLGSPPDGLNGEGALTELFAKGGYSGQAGNLAPPRRGSTCTAAGRVRPGATGSVRGKSRQEACRGAIESYFARQSRCREETL